jgi:hypothetical protein
VEGCAERRKFGAARYDNAAVQLQNQDAIRGEPRRCALDEAPVGLKTVAGREDGGERLDLELRVIGDGRCGDVRQIGDDHIEQTGHRIEEVAVADDDATLEVMAADVLAREGDGTGTRVRCPNFGPGAEGRDRDGDRSRAGAHVRDTGPAFADARCHGCDELLAGRSRTHDAPRRAKQLKTVEANLGHNSSVSQRRRPLPCGLPPPALRYGRRVD